ncbi:TRAP transporter 4TM/12TM fusion protein [Amorphus suaedae]
MIAEATPLTTGTETAMPADETSARFTFDRWRSVLEPAALVAVAWAVFQAVVAFAPYMDNLVKRGTHLSFALALALLLTSREGPVWWRRFNQALAVLALTPPFVMYANLERTLDRFSGIDPLAWQDYYSCFVFLALLFEASRRLLGLGMTLLAAFFVIYYFTGDYWPGLLAHRSTDLFGFVEVQVLSADGLLGIPIGVSVDVVYYFILFAAVFEIFGGGRLIIDLALAIAGRTQGGPAKTAVIASGMMGSVSGSAVANVMSTGIFTIPLMMRVRYAPRFAGAVEAVASTGGQIMPPVMGAAAFIMADFLRVPYSDIVLASILPAFFYFFAVLLCVDLEARRKKLPLIKEGEVPTIRETVRKRGIMIIPLGWLAYRIVTGQNVTYASIEAIALTILIGSLNPASRQRPLEIVQSLARCSERALSVALPCALAGVIISVIAFTGLGTKFTSLVVELSAGYLPLILLFAMVATIILGAGMPTSSAYIMGAILIAPALIRLGLEPITAHFFAFYFAILSMLTPPVALSSYAAATISGASASDTGWTAVKLAIPGFLIPYSFVLHPGLLLIDTPMDTVIGIVSLLFGFIAFAPAIIGWMFRDLNPVERVLAFALGVLSLAPNPLVSLAALVMIALLIGWFRYSARRNGPAPSPEAST